MKSPENRQPEDHPRLRGEKFSVLAFWFVVRGSPPLTRGKVAITFTNIYCIGITPAYAGKSKDFRTGFFVTEDHPRLRGEKYVLPQQFTPLHGSPPLTRGKVRVLQVVIVHCRITPAYAGKSPCCCDYWVGEWDHPRLRGEKLLVSFLFIYFSGSPPLTRGKVKKSFAHVNSIRITPAYAGKSKLFSDTLKIFEDHPRLRGEKGKTNRRCRNG